MYLLRLMLVGVWLGLLWVLFYFFDHYIQSSVQFSSVQFKPSPQMPNAPTHGHIQHHQGLQLPRTLL